MSTSPVSPEDIRAAAEVHAELGPEYSDAVVAAFIAEVDRQLAARVEARLASAAQEPPAAQENRLALLKGVVIGVCAGALTVAGIGLAVPRGSMFGVSRSVPEMPVHRGPIQARELPYILPGPRIVSPPGGSHPSR
ncbi:MAG TPA: hypothetical protein VMA32_11270 [Streptosporangiaceae bacterium]|nr:hypothetical protein [Streptosporangiaceae bacterium]